MKRIILVGVCIIAIISSILLSRKSPVKEIYDIEDDFKIEAKEMSYCSNEPFEYDSREDRTIYLMCMNEIELEDSKRRVTLYDYLDQKDNTLNDTIDKITSKLKVTDRGQNSLWTIYKDIDKNISDGSLFVTKCNNEDNRDIYFSMEPMTNETVTSLGICEAKKEEEKPELSLTVTYKEACEEKPVLYLEKDGQKVYTKCLNSIDVLKKGNEALELDRFMKEDTSNLDMILKHMELVNTLKDGGTKIYRTDESSKISNEAITVIKCHRIKDDNLYNEDIIIGDGNLEYVEDFCRDEETTQE